MHDLLLRIRERRETGRAEVQAYLSRGVHNEVGLENSKVPHLQSPSNPQTCFRGGGRRVYVITDYSWQL